MAKDCSTISQCVSDCCNDAVKRSMQGESGGGGGGGRTEGGKKCGGGGTSWNTSSLSLSLSLNQSLTVATTLKFPDFQTI